jgi:uncharacterized protein (TIGR02147 family)
MVNIFGFTDYREYLKAYFVDRKKYDYAFSHRWLARRLDLATSNFILLVMQGKRNLTQYLCHRIADVFKLSRAESDYFECMVNFSQAKSSSEKNLHFGRMATARKDSSVNKIEEHQYEYYSNWYNPVIRELVTSREFDGNPKTLARMLVPPITAAKAKRSIELLLKLGMIRPDGNRYVQTASLIATDREVNSLAVLNFHRSMGTLALESFDRIAKNERNITASTIYINEDQFDVIRVKIDALRKEILSLAENAAGERVYQINFQLFPLTKSAPNTEREV